MPVGRPQGECAVGQSHLAAEVGNGHARRHLAGEERLGGLEGAIAMAEEHVRFAAIEGCGHDVRIAVTVDVAGRNRRIEHIRVIQGHSRSEGSIPVAEEGPDVRDPVGAVKTGDHQVEPAIFVEVGEPYRAKEGAWTGLKLERLLGLERPVPSPQKGRHGHQTRNGGIDRDQVGLTIAVEVADAEGGGSRRGIEPALGLERAVAATQQHRDVGRGIVRHDHVGEAVVVHIDDHQVTPCAQKALDELSAGGECEGADAELPGAWKVPSPLPRKTLIVLDNVLETTRSGLPSPLRSPTAMCEGPNPSGSMIDFRSGVAN